MGEDSNRRNKTVVVIVIIVLVLAILTGVWYWFIYKPEQEAKEKARIEQIVKVDAEKKRKELQAQKKAKYEKFIENADTAFEGESWDAAHSTYSEALSLFPKEAYPQDQLTLVNEKLAEISAKSVTGIIENITSATGRFYIVASSSIDGDLAMDYGKKLAAEGTSVKIIEPYSDIRYYRVSLSDYDTWDNAVTASASFNTTSGDMIWILNY
jgi:hypothetical protein